MGGQGGKRPELCRPYPPPTLLPGPIPGAQGQASWEQAPYALSARPTPTHGTCRAARAGQVATPQEGSKLPATEERGKRQRARAGGQAGQQGRGQRSGGLGASPDASNCLGNPRPLHPTPGCSCPPLC